ncbi:hypothetical protein BDD12DRAFT_897566 [Trichophaea hybrida]|nr:hypothetical protein BDD12DRAFT_897566 [Trichophaea hybrida]
MYNTIWRTGDKWTKKLFEAIITPTMVGHIVTTPRGDLFVPEGHKWWLAWRNFWANIQDKVRASRNAARLSWSAPRTGNVSDRNNPPTSPPEWGSRMKTTNRLTAHEYSSTPKGCCREYQHWMESRRMSYNEELNPKDEVVLRAKSVDTPLAHFQKRIGDRCWTAQVKGRKWNLAPIGIGPVAEKGKISGGKRKRYVDSGTICVVETPQTGDVAPIFNEKRDHHRADHVSPDHPRSTCNRSSSESKKDADSADGRRIGVDAEGHGPEQLTMVLLQEIMRDDKPEARETQEQTSSPEASNNDITGWTTVLSTINNAFEHECLDEAIKDISSNKLWNAPTGYRKGNRGGNDESSKMESDLYTELLAYASAFPPDVHEAVKKPAFWEFLSRSENQIKVLTLRAALAEKRDNLVVPKLRKYMKKIDAGSLIDDNSVIRGEFLLRDDARSPFASLWHS